MWSLLKPQKRDDTPLAYYIGAAVVNNLSMVTAYAALKWVSYPTQIILKSGKPISVMLFGVLICKRYTTQRYFFVVLVVIGVIIFNLYKPIEKIQAMNENSNEMLGISLLVMSITMDGVLGMIQDKIRVAHSPTSQQMMLSMNAWGTGIILILLIVTHEIVDVFHFMCRHMSHGNIWTVWRFWTDFSLYNDLILWLFSLFNHNYCTEIHFCGSFDDYLWTSI